MANGAPAERVVVTGMPNFDDCARFRHNDFPLHGYALACTSDARETFKLDDRRAFIKRAVELAGGRELVFKLHPTSTLAEPPAKSKPGRQGLESSARGRPRR